MLYYVFYKVNFVNEFEPAFAAHSNTNMNNNSIAQNYSLTSREELDESENSKLVQINIFRIDSFFMFANFQLYPLSQARNRLISYQVLYGTLNSLFLIFILSIGFTTHHLFRVLKQVQDESSKEWERFFLRILSIIMALFMYPLMIPMLTTNLQGYLCGEDLLKDLSISEVQCGSLENQILRIVSTAIIILYITFLLVQNQLYSSISFESPLPWASFDRGVSSIKLLQKLLISLTLIFDKTAKNRQYELLAIASLGLVITSQRLTTSIIFNKNVHYATGSYELMLNWLFLSVALHQIAGTEITIGGLLLIILSGIILILLTFYLTDLYNQAIFVQQCEQPDKLAFMTSNSFQSELFCYRMCHLLVTSEPDHQNPHQEMLLQGLIQVHLENCNKPDCLCEKIIGGWQMRKHHVKLGEEEAYLKQIGIQEKQMQKWSHQQMGRALQDNNIYNSHNLEGPESPNIKDEDQKQNLKQAPTAIIQRQDAFNGTLKPSYFKQIEENKIQQDSSKIRVTHGVQFAIPGSKRSSGTIHSPNHHQVEEDLSKMDTILRNKKESFILRQNSKLIRDDSLISGDLEEEIDNSNQKNEITKSEEESSESFEKMFQNVDHHTIQEESLTMKYHYLSLFVDKAISLFPKSVELRLHNAYLQSQKLSNDFKAVFELMKAEQFSPSMRNKFYIFRRRILIERNLMNKNHQNITLQEKINPLTIYNYEKLFLRYMKLEYLAATSSLNFWRELLQKQVNSNVLINRGAEITKCYTRIQDVATKILEISPNDIKFYYKYANFLKMIVNNEQEAEKLFDHAAQIYSVLSSSTKKATHYGGRSAEELIFGENTAVAVVMISLATRQVGDIIHSNDEIYRILGYKRKNLIGKKINSIMPGPIGMVHDRFLRKFLDTARRNVIEEIRQMPAVCADGYIRPVTLCVKLFPQISDKVVIIGFIQHLNKFDNFEAEQLTGIAPGALSKVTHHYVITDTNNGIACLSEELAHEVGLNSKFFKSQDMFQQQKLSIDKVFGHLIMSNQYQEDLMGRGIEMEINTRNILHHVNLEQLSAEELGSVKSRIGVYPVHIMLKKLSFELCQINLYRIIFLPSMQHQDSFEHLETNSNSQKFVLDSQGQEMSTDQGQSNSQFEMSSQLSSTSTAADQANGTRRGMQDFKASIARRETPKNIIILSRLLLIVSILLILLTSSEYSLKLSFIDESSIMANYLITSERRTIKFIETAINIRSFIDVSNGIEHPTYTDEFLKRFTRFLQLRQTIQKSGEILQEAQDSLMQHQKFGMEVEEFETIRLQLTRLSDYQNVVPIELPFRVSFNNYINNILLLNVHNESQLSLNPWLLQGISLGFKENRTIELDEMKKNLYFNLVNGFRLILRTIQDSNYMMQKAIDKVIQSNRFSYIEILLVLSLSVTIISLILVIKELFTITKTKRNILNIFSLLSNEEIKKVYDICDMFIDQFENGGYQVIYYQDDEEEGISNQENGNQSPLALIQKKMAENLLGTTYQTKNVLQRLSAGLQKRFFVKKESAQHQSQLISLSTMDYNDNNSNSGVLNAAQKFYVQRMRQLEGQQISAEEHYGRLLKQSLSIIRDEKQISFTQKHKKTIELNNKETITKKKTTAGSLFQSIGAPAKKKKQQVMMNTFELRRHERDQFQNAKKSKIKEETKDGMGRKQRRQQPVQKTKNTNKTIEEAKESEEEDYDDQSSSHSSDLESNEFEPNSQRNLQVKETIKRSNQIGSDLYKESEKAKQKGGQKTIVTIESNQQTQKSGITQIVLAKLLVTLIFVCYLVYSFVYHQSQLDVFNSIQQNSPIFFKRYQSLYLSYAFLRERIITQNRYTTQQLGFQIPTLPQETYLNYKDMSIDDYYHQMSLEVESQIIQLKISRPKGLDPILDLIQIQDSPQFCQSIYEPRVLEPLQDLTDSEKVEFSEIRKNAYKKEIDTVISACTAASEDDIEAMRSLRRAGVDLNIGDYDNRTPIHVAVATGRIKAVKYLIEEAGVNVSPIDRWYSTPMNDALQFPSIFKYLQQKGSFIGKQWPYVVVQGTASLDQFRIVYAATYGDLKTLDALRRLGVDLNGMDYDGRTALHLAASEGKLQIIEYLSKHVEDMLVKDARLNDALDDAQRGNFTDSENYLVSVLIGLRNDSCVEYANGLFEKGMQQAIGSFQRKFADLQIALQAAKKNEQFRELLTGAKMSGEGQSTVETIKTFFSVSELFIHKAVDKLLKAVDQSYKNFRTQYLSVLEISYFLFLAFQILTLLVFRRKLIIAMRDEIMKSRGILNLVPVSFFMENKEASERVMQIMKN